MSIQSSERNNVPVIVNPLHADNEDSIASAHPFNVENDPNYSVSSVTKRGPGVNKRKIRWKCSWIYIICIFSTFVLVFVTLLWNRLDNCSLQSSSFDCYYSDHQMKSIVLKDGTSRYCYSEYITSDFEYIGDDSFDDNLFYYDFAYPGTYRCSIGAKSDEHFCGMYTDTKIQDNPSCYERTENCDEVVLVYYMSCMPADVALNAALSFSLYACLFVSFIYFLVRIVQKKLSVWELESWKQVVIDSDGTEYEEMSGRDGM